MGIIEFHHRVWSEVSSCAGSTASLREEWEATGFQLEHLQCAVECVEEEQAGQSGRQTPQWNVPYQPRYTSGFLVFSTLGPLRPRPQNQQSKSNSNTNQIICVDELWRLSQVWRVEHSSNLSDYQVDSILSTL